MEKKKKSEIGGILEALPPAKSALKKPSGKVLTR